MVSINSSFINSFVGFGNGVDLGQGTPTQQAAAAQQLAEVATVLADPRTQAMARAGALAAGAMMQHQLLGQVLGSPFGMMSAFPQMMQQMMQQALLAQAFGQALQGRGFGAPAGGCGGAGGFGGGGDIMSMLDRLLAQNNQQRSGGAGGARSAPGLGGARSPAGAPRASSPRTNAPIANAPGVPQATGSTAGARALSLAQSQVGVREASGNNDGIPAQRYSGGRNEPWCANFVAWAFRQSGNQVPGNQRSLASARHLENTFKQQGKWFSPRQGTPQPGDVIWFPRSGGSGRHVGIVEKVENGRVHTIEGNSSNAVRRRSYDLNSPRIVGYGRM